MAALLLLAALLGCTTVPETGRRQLILIGSEQASQLGAREFEAMRKELPEADNPAQKELLQRVGRDIARVVDLPDAQWEFVLFDKPDTPNAFALPGGKVGVYTGILPITETPAGLAAVIGHEVAHVVARHGSERMSQGLLVEIGGQALDAALQGESGGARSAAMIAYGLGSQIGVLLPYSREHELEADHLGMLYMARAGYDPREAIEFWKRFARYSDKQGEQGPEFLSTHPLDETRVRRLQAVLDRALREYEAARAGR